MGWVGAGRHGITFGVYNVRGMDKSSMVDDMNRMVKAEEIDIVGIVESWRGREEGRREREGLDIDRRGLEQQRRDMFGEDWVCWKSCANTAGFAADMGGGLEFWLRQSWDESEK